MFVKNIMKVTVLPNHRMQVSSKNRTKKLIAKSSRIGRDSRSPRRGEASLPGLGEVVRADTEPPEANSRSRS
jgi:hypothetical protein